MSSALYIVLERKVDGLDTSMDGTSLYSEMDVLDTMAADLEVRPLSEFFSIDPAVAEELYLAAGIAMPASGFAPLEKFSAKDGLATVQALIRNPESLSPEVNLDLQDCKRILEAAVREDVRWHFEADM